MAGKTEFEEFLAREVQEARSVSFPVHTSLLRRILTKKTRCRNLHPNPEDEFCDPDIGPNYSIISEYQDRFLNSLKHAGGAWEGEPIIVERLHPEGYRILNGHHRWAAALRLGLATLPIKIVNFMHEEDIKRILKNSTHTKRAALDLDEVVFAAEGEGPLEAPLSFPWDRLYPQRVRLGVPALFHFLATNGYDIWLYSSDFYSADTIQGLFRKYHVEVTGVISAVGRRTSRLSGKELEKLIGDSYRVTLHIDSRGVVRSTAGTRQFREVELSGSAESWSDEVMRAVEAMEREGEEGAQT